MPQLLKTTVARMSDSDCIVALEGILTSESGKHFSRFIYNLPGDGQQTVPIAETEQNEVFVLLKSSPGRSLERIGIQGEGNAQITVARVLDQPSLLDKLEISPGGQQSPLTQPLVFVRAVTDAQAAFREVPYDIREFAGQQEAARVEASEVMLARLQTIAGNMVESITKQQEANQRSYEAQRDELDNQNRLQVSQFEAEQSQQRAAIEAEKQELALLRSQLDSSRNTRRQIRDDLKKAVKEEARLQFNPVTKSQKKAVMIGYATLMAFFVAVYGVSLHFADQSAGVSAWLPIAQRALAAIGVVGTAAFFLRWLNSWSTRTADAEFKLKQFELDIDRASWIVELIQECGEKPELQLPPELVEQLSKNLFAETADRRRESMTALDALATAILGTAASAEVQVPGGSLGFKKGDLRRLGKRSIDDGTG